MKAPTSSKCCYLFTSPHRAPFQNIWIVCSKVVKFSDREMGTLFSNSSYVALRRALFHRHGHWCVWFNYIQHINGCSLAAFSRVSAYSWCLAKGGIPAQNRQISSDWLIPCPEQIKVLWMADSVGSRQTSILVLLYEGRTESHEQQFFVK